MKKITKKFFTLLLMAIYCLSFFCLTACNLDESDESDEKDSNPPGTIEQYKEGDEVHHKITGLQDGMEIYVKNNMHFFHIKGDSGKVYKNVEIKIEARDTDVKLYLSNVNIIGKEVAILSYGGTVDNIEIIAEGGNSSIKGNTGYSAINGFGNITFTGNGKLNISGGDKSSETDVYAIDSCNKITVAMTGSTASLTIKGGNGCNGVDGSRGANGATASLGVSSTPGKVGGKGTDGTNGSVVLPETTKVNHVSGSFTLAGGDGGNGGNGGAGGTGGETSPLAQGQQPGGKGGDGGNAGHGGNVFLGSVYTSDESNLKNIPGNNGTPGAGGEGGWSGGRRQNADVPFQSENGADGEVLS